MFSDKIRIEIVKKYISGTSSPKLMKEYGIKGSGTVSNWVRIFNESGIEGLNNLNTKT
ncbi:helix-turn-helix domain-containing protein, partial [Latilactobacillus fuchuensis]